MKVVATKLAFYNGARVRPGAEVEVPDSLKGSWFAKPSTPAAAEAKAPKEPKSRAPKTLSEMAKQTPPSREELV